MTRLRIVLVSTVGVALVASVGINLYQFRRLADCRRLRDADLQSLRELRGSVRQSDVPKPPAMAEGPSSASNYRATLAERDTTIERLNSDLSEAHATIAQLQGQLSSSSDERERALASAKEGYQKERDDWQGRLDTLQQKLDSAEAELQASRQRLLNLEAANAKLRSDYSEGSSRAAEFGRVVAGLQDLESRRDAYLTSIMRRYRDITSQFRAMSGMLDSSRDSNSSTFSGAALGRIQNAISLADDDLRQLNELNAQARQLEKKLKR